MQNKRIMGIVNVTPDSFFDGGMRKTCAEAIDHALSLIDQGADIIDIGGESTRPGSDSVSIEEELSRVIPVIKGISKQSSVVISIDTMKAEVAKQAMEAGASLINDVTGFSDVNMIEVAKRYNAQICIMHMQGKPKTMQENPKYEEGVVQHLINWIDDKRKQLSEAGIPEGKMIFDPGIGFGKSVAHNLEILHNLQMFKDKRVCLLIGLSRKSFMSRLFNKKPAELLPETCAFNAMACFNGADIIRVHDVDKHKQMIERLRYYLEA